MTKPNLAIFASGTKEGGGSGAENLIRASRDGRLDANVVAVFCNIENGGVKTRLEKLHQEGFNVPFVYFPKGERTPERHQELVRELGGNECFVALSGCLWLVPMKESPKDASPGLDPRFVFNIHPGPLPHFGGDGMYGHFVHEAVIAARVKNSAVTMHFVTKRYDDGPVFFELPVPILPTDDADSLGKAVNAMEHRYQPMVTNEVVHGRIKWNGVDAESLVVPMGWQFL